jgi:hypothetical protein
MKAVSDWLLAFSYLSLRIKRIKKCLAKLNFYIKNSILSNS